MGSDTKVDLQSYPIIFFDGVCNLCNGAVQFIIKHDKKKVFKLAPLQSTHAKFILESQYQQLDSIVLFQEGLVYTKSDAALRIAGNLGFPLSMLSWFKIIPRFFRDFLYDFIAKNRYKWFGKSSQCMLPSADNMHRFLKEE